MKEFGLTALFNSMKDACSPSGDFKNTCYQFDWSAKGVGFGQFYFYMKDDKLHCSNELMSKRFIKQMLCKMVDDAIMDDPHKLDSENE
ncbi:MAG: hypothetical protein ABIO44_08710 [Saprospiraceae bacterium]